MASEPTTEPARFGRCNSKTLIDAGAECAKLAVPLDYSHPRGARVEIAISRIKATKPDKRRGILLFNPGGPGGSGLAYPTALRQTLGDVAERYDLIGFDPRFVGASSAISCSTAHLGDVVRAAGLDRAGFDESRRLSADFARRCHERNAKVLPFAGTPDVARDMDSIRAALGEQKLSYYGVSYGADLGAMYSELFGKRVDRMVIDSVSSVKSEYDLNRAGVARAEAALDEWGAWAAQRDGTYHLGKTAVDVRKSVGILLAQSARQPIAVGNNKVDDNVLPFLLRNWLVDESNNGVIAQAVSDLRGLAAGQHVTPSEPLVAMVGQLTQEHPDIDKYLAVSFAVFCADRRWPTDPAEYWRNIQRSRKDHPVFGSYGNNIGPCAYWRDRSPEKPVTVANNVQLLIVQALRDNTPFAQAQDLHRRLTGSRLLAVDIRAHGLYGRQLDGLEPVACAERAVNGYLRNGQLPPKDSTCRVDNQ